MALMRLSECLEGAFPCQEKWAIRLARGWDKAIGDLHERMRLEAIKDDQVVVGVYDSRWIPELFLLTPLLIKSMNDYLGGTFVRRIRFVLVEKSTRGALKKVIPDENTRKQPKMSMRQEQILGTIKDEELKDVLEKFFYASVN